MKKEKIDWGYLMGRLLLDTACYDAPGPFALDEEGQLLDSFDGEDAEALCLDAQKTYPLCTDVLAQEDGDEEDLY